MVDLKIIKLKDKCDIKALEAILRKMPGLTASQISMGLRYQPFKVLTTGDEQAQPLKNTLEAKGAICIITPAADPSGRGREGGEAEEGIPEKEDEKKFQWRFLLAIFGILAFLIIATIYFSNTKSTKKQKEPALPQTTVVAVQVPKEVQEQEQAARKREAAKATKSRNALKHDLVKNSYDTEAWKALAENLEEQGDTAAARVARASYDKAVRTQQVLASLAKTFGNNVRVEVTAAAVYYRTSKDLTEEQLYIEAERLRDSLSIKFPGKRSLVIENYTSNNKVQRIILEPNYVPEKTVTKDRLF